MQKKVLLTALLVLATIIKGWCQRYDSKRSYETFGLAKGDAVSEMFIYGVLCVVGIIIINKLTNSKDNPSQSSIPTFLMMALGVMAFIFFLPLLSWIEIIFVSVVHLGIALVVVSSIGYFIYSIFKANP